MIGRLVENGGPLAGKTSTPSFGTEGSFDLVLAGSKSVAEIEEYILEKLKTENSNIKGITEASISHDGAALEVDTGSVTFTIALEAANTHIMPNDYKSVRVVVAASGDNKWAKTPITKADFEAIATDHLSNAVQGFTPDGTGGIKVTAAQGKVTITLTATGFDGTGKYDDATNSIEAKYSEVLAALANIGIKEKAAPADTTTQFEFTAAGQKTITATMKNLELGKLYEFHSDLTAANNNFASVEIVFTTTGNNWTASANEPAEDPELEIELTTGSATSPLEVTLPSEINADIEETITITLASSVSGVTYNVDTVDAVNPAPTREGGQETHVAISEQAAITAGNYTVVEDSDTATTLKVTLTEEALIAIATDLSKSFMDEGSGVTPTKYGKVKLNVTASKQDYKSQPIEIYVKVKAAAAAPYRR